MPPASASYRRQLEARIAETSALQHAVISRRQAVSLGMSSAAISRRFSSGQWVRTLPGVYRFAVARQTPAQRVCAASLWAGPNGGVSHRTALSVWGCPFPFPFDLIDVLTSERRDPREGLKVHQVRRLPSSHLTTFDGVFLTTPERTLLDLASLAPWELMRECEFEYAPDELLATALDFFLERGLVSLQSLAAFLSEPAVRGLPGRRNLARAVRFRCEDHSRPVPGVFEAKVKAFARRERITPLDENVPVGDGSVTLPLGYKALKVAVLQKNQPIPDALRRALARERWQAFYVDPAELTCDLEYAAFRFCAVISMAGGIAPPPWRRRPVKRTWLDTIPRMRVREAIYEWRRGTNPVWPRLPRDDWHVQALPGHDYYPGDRIRWPWERRASLKVWAWR